MTKQQAWDRALAQLSIDYNAPREAFLAEGVTLTESKALPGRRRYSEQAPFFQMATTGRGAVIAADPCLHEGLRAWTAGREQGHWLFEQQNTPPLEALLAAHGWQLFMTHHMFLPTRSFTPRPLPAGLTERWYDERTVYELYPSAFHNAISETENLLRPDVIALAALEGETIVALAGASADAENFWQVGIDVLPAWRGRGLGSLLVENLCARMEERGAVPFYGTAPANLHSQNIALNCGFRPAWVELTSKPKEE